MDGEDRDACVVGGEEVEIAGESGAVGQFGEDLRGWAGGVVVALEEFDEALDVAEASSLSRVRCKVLACAVDEAGFIENALAEVRRAEGLGEFAPGSEFFGDG